MPPRLLDFLSKPRYQILFYLFKFGKISTSNSKSHISRSFGYKSVGHFWSDFNYLIENDLIIVRHDNYILGSEGKKEMLFFSRLEIGFYFSISFTLMFFWYYYMSLRKIILPNVVYLLAAIFLLVLSYIFYNTQKTFNPELPPSVNDLKNR